MLIIVSHSPSSYLAGSPNTTHPQQQQQQQR